LGTWSNNIPKVSSAPVLFLNEIQEKEQISRLQKSSKQVPTKDQSGVWAQSGPERVKTLTEIQKEEELEKQQREQRAQEQERRRLEHQTREKQKREKKRRNNTQTIQKRSLGFCPLF